jgi:hypothetical protein
VACSFGAYLGRDHVATLGKALVEAVTLMQSPMGAILAAVVRFGEVSGHQPSVAVFCDDGGEGA